MEPPVVVLISAGAEWRAVRDRIATLQAGRTPYGEWRSTRLEPAGKVILTHGGWGKIDAAGSTQHALDRWRPRLLVNLGTCGGFQGRAEVGEILLAERTVVYDILDRMSDPEASLRRYVTDLDLSWLPDPAPLPVRRTVMVSGDRDLRPQDLSELVERYGAVGGDWESGAIARVCFRCGVPCLILRGVTDLVGPDGGEADGQYELFARRARAVMERLLDSLPAWLTGGGGREQGLSSAAEVDETRFRAR